MLSLGKKPVSLGTSSFSVLPFNRMLVAILGSDNFTPGNQYYFSFQAKLNGFWGPYSPRCLLSGPLMKSLWNDRQVRKPSPREQTDEPAPRSPCIFRLCNFETSGSHTPSESQSVADKPSVTGLVCMMTTLNTVWLPPWRVKKGHLLAGGPKYTLEEEI